MCSSRPGSDTKERDPKNSDKGAKLTTNALEFSPHGKPSRILSGAIHYFRVVPEYWKNRLLKLKAMET